MPALRSLSPARVFRSEQHSAIVLLAAAVLGLTIANTPLGPPIMALRDTVLTVPFTEMSLTLGHWIVDGLLVVFFFLVAVELRFELTKGELRSPRRALAPAAAAIGGVVIPALIFVAFTAGTEQMRGWPVPTATDIAFALGVLALLGRGLPRQVRVFLLAVAILDDLIGILIIAINFTVDIDLGMLVAAVVVVALFGVLSRVMLRVPGWRRNVIRVALVLLALAAWFFVHESGVHATIAGVSLGLVMQPVVARLTASNIAPWSNGVVLPLFAFTAALVAFPAAGVADLHPAFWGISVGLVVGKLIGITLFGWIASRLLIRQADHRLVLPDLITVATLGGIGFTVALLMSQLAFRDMPGYIDESTLAVLAGSGVATVLSVIVVSLRARHYRRRLAERAMTLEHS